MSDRPKKQAISSTSNLSKRYRGTVEPLKFEDPWAVIYLHNT